MGKNGERFNLDFNIFNSSFFFAKWVNNPYLRKRVRNQESEIREMMPNSDSLL